MRAQWNRPGRWATAILAPVLLAGCGSSGEAKAPAPGADRAATAAQLRSLAAKRMATAPSGTVIVGGVVDAAGHRTTFVVGRSPRGLHATARTRMEIGSLTKTLTGTLLAARSLSGAVALTDPVERTLGPGWSVPSLGGVPITLGALATHQSGLARLPGDTDVASDDPYATIDDLALQRALQQPSADGGTTGRYAYSNVGMGLLGAALARQAGTSYPALLRSTLTDPLGMTATAVNTPGSAHEQISGHDPAGRRASPWHFDALAGAGGVVSNVDDLLTFAHAGLTPPPGPVGDAMRLALSPRSDIAPHLRIGLGWHVSDRVGRPIAFHDGGTGGFSSGMVLDRRRGIGIVLLSNATSPTVLDLALHVVDPAVPVLQVVPLSRTALNALAGSYRVDGTAVVIARRGGRLLLSAPGQPARAVVATGPRTFASGDDAEITVQFLPARGAVRSVKLTAQGQTVTGPRTR